MNFIIQIKYYQFNDLQIEILFKILNNITHC